jgi:hypothetical protein
MKGPTPNANTSKRPKVLHTERRAVMIETFVEFLLRITLYVSADSRSGHVGNSVYDLNQPKGQKKCANARPGRCDRGFLIAATLFALQGQARIVKKVSDCDNNNIIYRFEEACELKWEPYRPTSSLRSREDSLSLALPDGLLPPLRHSVTPAQHS